MMTKNKTKHRLYLTKADLAILRTLNTCLCVLGTKDTDAQTIAPGKIRYVLSASVWIEVSWEKERSKSIPRRGDGIYAKPFGEPYQVC